MQQSHTALGQSGNQNNIKMKYACSLLWSHAKLNVHGHISPCCNFDENKSPQSMPTPPQIKNGIQNSIDSEYMNTVRQRMISGEKLPECHRCHHAEESGHTSLRTFSNRWNKHIGETPKIRFLETAFSTHCNLACRMCDETFSSKWKLINSPGISPETAIVNYDLNIYDCDLSELQAIKVLGGEPLLSKEHDKFLENVISKSNNPKDITLVYHTNATIYPNKNIINMWRKLKNVRLALSIDGVGKLNEYLRPGHKWETIENNINKFKQLEFIELSNLGVIHNLNILHIVDFCRWNEETFGKVQPMNLLNTPEHLSIKNMSQELKQKSREQLDIMLSTWPDTIDFYNWCINTMSEDGDELTFMDMRKHQKKLDVYFNQNFLEYNKS